MIKYFIFIPKFSRCYLNCALCTLSAVQTLVMICGQTFKYMSFVNLINSIYLST